MLLHAMTRYSTVAPNCLLPCQALWESHRDDLSEDFTFTRLCQHRTRGQPSLANESDYNATLRAIAQVLSLSDRTLGEFGLPEPPRQATDPEAANNPDMEQQLAFDREALANRVALNLPLLNPEQRVIYDDVLASIYGPGPERARGHFLQAPGGCGKTFLLNCIIDTVSSRGDIVLAVASTGVAALLMEAGSTAHFRFKIPIPTTAESTCRITPINNAGQLLARAKLVVWDEAITTHRHAHEAVSRLEFLLYGGKTYCTIVQCCARFYMFSRAFTRFFTLRYYTFVCDSECMHTQRQVPRCSL